MISSALEDRNRSPGLAAVLSRILLLLVSCAPLKTGFQNALDSVDGGLESVRSGTNQATLVSILIPQFGGLVNSVLLDREDDDLSLTPRRGTSVESARVELGRLDAVGVAASLTRLENHPAVRAAGTEYHASFRSWTLFPIVVRNRLRGYMASVDGLAIFQVKVQGRDRERVVYYQDSSHFAEETGSGGGPG